MSATQWWNRWFDEQATFCGVIRHEDSGEIVRAALGSTPATTALVAEIILSHERERAVANAASRDWGLTLRR
jgi:hypothetical protein